MVRIVVDAWDWVDKLSLRYLFHSSEHYLTWAVLRLSIKMTLSARGDKAVKLLAGRSKVEETRLCQLECQMLMTMESVER